MSNPVYIEKKGWMYYNKSIMKQKWLVAVWLMIGIWACKAAPDSTRDQQAEAKAEASDRQSILTINDQSFTNRDLKDFITLQYSDTFTAQANEKLLSRLFDQFIDQQLVVFKAKQEGIEVSPAESDDYFKKMNIAPADVNAKSKLTQDAIKVQKYLITRVYNTIQVDDREIQRYYESHLDEFRKTDEILLHQILLKDREKAIRVRGELLNSPGRFVEMARLESESPEAADGGQMGYFERGVLPAEMENVVFSLKIEEISPVVESPYGFHIFKVTEKRRRRLLTLKMVLPEVKNKLMAEKLNQAYENFLGQLRRELTIQVRYPNLYFSYQPIDNGETANANQDSQNPATAGNS